MDWFVYILECADSSLYTGVTTDLQRRIEEHNHDDKKGARYTRYRRPVRMIYQEQCQDRSHASQREHQIKQLTRAQKLQLIESK